MTGKRRELHITRGRLWIDDVEYKVIEIRRTRDQYRIVFEEPAAAARIPLDEVPDE